MADYEIAVAGPEDLDVVHRIESEAFPSPWRREFFESELQATNRFNLVARESGGVVAYVFAMWFYDEMHINKIAVEKLSRRQGIADALMARCIDFALKEKIATISLEVRASNVIAQSFYRHLGFEPTYTRARYYPDGEAAVVMMLVLGPSNAQRA